MLGGMLALYEKSLQENLMSKDDIIGLLILSPLIVLLWVFCGIAVFYILNAVL
jgi:hypothetical protein